LQNKEKEIEEITIVASSRTGQKIENSPQKVEVLGRRNE
jgi:iron complex outermembrane receptor protein/outer membrane receptor for ferrienterochelin and colicins